MTKLKVMVVGVVLLIGGIVLVRGVLRASPSAGPPGNARPVPATALQPPTAPTVPVELTVRLEHSTNAETLADTLAEIERRAASEFQRVADPGDSRAAGFGAEIGAYMRQVLAASFDEFVNYVQARCGAVPDDIDERAEHKAYFESTSPAYQFSPLSVENLRVRRRVADGAELEVEWFEGRVRTVTAPNRFSVLRSLLQDSGRGVKIIGETYEALVPIAHNADGKATTVMLGVWLTWVPGQARWLPSRVDVYGPSDLLPMLSPAL